jgi:Rrf2 family protein
MISQTAEYALRAIVYLATQQEAACTTAHISEATQVPSGYLAKVMQNLGRAGLVASQRGLNGGFVLTKPPEELTVLEVINAVDPIRRIRVCPLGIEEHRSLCPLHRKLDSAAAMLEDTFRGTTMDELLPTSTRAKSVCHFPCLTGT